MDFKTKLQITASVILYNLAMIAVMIVSVAFDWVSIGMIIHPIIGPGIGILFGGPWLVVAVVWVLDSESEESWWTRKTDDQLSSYEAQQLLDYYLFYEENMNTEGGMVEKGPDNVNSEFEDEPIRLYKMVFERKNYSEKVGVLIDLEQPLSVDPENPESLRRTAKKIDDLKIIRGSKVSDFDSAMREARKEIGRSKIDRPTKTVRSYDDDGNLAAEREEPIEVYNPGKLPEKRGE